MSRPQTIAHRLGASDSTMYRVDEGNGTYSARMIVGETLVRGCGNTRREAAKHLANQLRELARLVVAQEGA